MAHGLDDCCGDYLASGIWPRCAGLGSRKRSSETAESGHTPFGKHAPANPVNWTVSISRSLLRTSGFERISILKIDVEGAEKRIFAENFEDWLGKVDALVIELHGQDCADVFHRAIGRYDFELSTCDELTVARRRAVAPSTHSRGAAVSIESTSLSTIELLRIGDTTSQRRSVTHSAARYRSEVFLARAVQTVVRGA